MMAEGVVRRSMLLAIVGSLTFTALVFGQIMAGGVKTPTYDVVAIKPDKAGGGMRMMWSPDRYSAENTTLKLMMKYAYNFRTDDHISGLPGWADSFHFDMEAKMDSDAVATLQKLPMVEQVEQRRWMMQQVLADRFRLKVRRETKNLSMYALVVVKDGFKLKEADPNDTYPNGIKGADGVSHAGMFLIGDGRMQAQAIPMSTFADDLSMQVERQIVDRTGLTGKYDIQLKWAPEEERQDAGSTAKDSGPSLFIVLQEQLGLRLESIKGPVDTIVVDHVEMPSEN
jgi:uncharacterized protein (TIGR03435 family)